MVCVLGVHVFRVHDPVAEVENVGTGKGPAFQAVAWLQVFVLIHLAQMYGAENHEVLDIISIELAPVAEDVRDFLDFQSAEFRIVVHQILFSRF